MSQSSKASRRGRVRKLGRGLGLALGSTLALSAAVAPALVEARVEQQLRERLGLSGPFAIDLDLDGLELRGLDQDLPGDRGRLRAERVRIRPELDGLHIEIEGLDARLRRRARSSAEAKAAPAPASKQAAPASKPPRAEPAEAGEDRLAETLQRLRGVPIHLRSEGRLALELSDGVVATAQDITLDMPGDGRMLGAGEFELGSGEGPAWARASLELAAFDERPRDIEVAGALDLAVDRERAGGERKHIDLFGRVSSRDARLVLGEPAGGRATLTVERRRAEGETRERVELDAEDLPLDLLAPLAGLLGRRAADFEDFDRVKFDLDEARMDGGLVLVRRRGPKTASLSLSFDGVELRDLGVESELIAGRPIHFDDLTLDGELVRERDPERGGPRNFGTLVLAHAGLQMQLSGQLDDEALAFELEIPRGECQALVEAMPRGAAPVLAGTALAGQVHAGLRLHLNFAELAAARKRYLVDGELVLPDEDFVPPGRLRFDFPFLESCAVDRLGPGADVAGLRGPYHHSFVSGAGVHERRVLAEGDANYVAIEDVPNLALAFVILEDARYWTHDGFDREQIERAFWFNLLEGRVRRGASTITQQAARSLWLGIDRSLTRKLAEALLAAELERQVGKRRILEVYLNVIELGPEIHGVVEASRYHFGKEPSELSLRQALHLASYAPAPVAYSRRFATGEVDEAWREHLRRQVKRMMIRHLINDETAHETLVGPLQLRAHPELLPD